MKRTASSLLVVPIVALSACSTAVSYKPAPGTDVYDFDEENALRAEIVEIRAIHKGYKSKIESHIKLHNRGPVEIRFDRQTAVLHYKNSVFPAKDFGLFGRENNVNVRPGGVKLKRWAFEVGEPPTPGTYDLKITNLNTYRNGVSTPTGKDMLIKIRVPGPGAS